MDPRIRQTSTASPAEPGDLSGLVRRAKDTDIDAIRHLGHESYLDHFSHIWTPGGIRRFLDADFSADALQATLTKPSKHLWLVAADPSQKLVGYAKLNWSTPDPVFGIDGVELQKIYFYKSAAGKGYGTAVIRHIFDCVEERSCRRIWLDVLKNNVCAQKFYEKMGFRSVGEIPFKTDIAEIGMIVMIKLANPSFNTDWRDKAAQAAQFKRYASN